MITQGIGGVRPKPSLAHVRARHPRSAFDHEIDEALWAAYRRYDKSAVTQNLLRRYLTTAKAVRRRRIFHS
ncbi:MAG: hypothetical protein DME80_07415 [Verrucomicrobia bacterium]|nr:MAG: hypothetical protein DME89_07285 [Verrucomicrobiota bacterium]PYJ43960.1 MAG: hypothetical protein DME80_07415 [Verrucomicrobiota bacterium]